MESLALIAAGFTLLLSAYALLCCWKDDSAAPHHKVVYTVMIMLLPVLGPVIFFKQRDEMRRNAKPRRKRSL